MTETLSADMHAKLRRVLADGSITFGEPRRYHGFSPVALLQDCIGEHRDVYVESTDAEGRPAIGLRPGAPPLDIMIDREPVLKLIAEAAERGVYLLRLRRHSRLASARIEQLLKGCAGIEPVSRNKNILYRRCRIDEQAKKNAGAVGLPLGEGQAVEYGRNIGGLLQLVSRSTRHLSWLENYFERTDIVRTIGEHSETFETEDANLANRICLCS